jgi:hypothetical protein
VDPVDGGHEGGGIESLRNGLFVVRFLIDFYIDL